MNRTYGSSPGSILWLAVIPKPVFLWIKSLGNKLILFPFCKKLQIPMTYQTVSCVKTTTPFLCCNISLILNQGLLSLLLPWQTHLTLQFVTTPKITERASEENGILNSIFILPAELNLNTSSVWKKQGLKQIS